MKFVYQYRTSENELRSGEISAPSRDAAFSMLKERGVRPSRVEEAPGFFNKVFGKGKRWIAIVILAVMALVAIFAFLEISREFRVVEESLQVEDRAQLFGDPVVIRECEEARWANVFHEAFDCYLAQYAIPGREVVAMAVPSIRNMAEATQLVDINENDLSEIAQMKKMVNGMKRELSEYVKSGGTVGGYLKRLEIRQKAERAIYETAQRQIQRTKDVAVWKEKNAELRAMGLPMVEFPDED